MNRELKLQLLQAFGLHSDGDVDELIDALRRGAEVDPHVLRRGCLALVDSLEASRAESLDSADRLKIALNASHIGLWDWDLVAGTVLFDSTLCQLLGIAQDGALRPIAEVAETMHPDDRDAFREAMRETLRGRTTLLQIKHRVRHTAGHWIWLETFGNVTQRDEQGRATRMTCTHADITERTELENARDNSLQVLQQLLETLPLPVIMRDAECRVTMVNAAWEKMMGMARQDIIGKQLDSASTRARTRNHLETDDLLISTRKPMRFETAINAPDGQIYEVIIAKTPLLAADGSLVGIASVVTDISEQKRTAMVLERARLSAEAAVQAKSRFLANMSHELRTPLNGVVGMASLLENTALDAKQRRFVQTLKSSAESLMMLINDVLDLSKAEAGKLGIANTPFNLRRELEHVVGLFAARAFDKGVEIAAHIARGAPATMQGDPIRLRQILGNLVNNAIKFTETGAVLLAVAVPRDGGVDDMLEFSVSDTGMGIAAEEQHRIFEAFEQADGSVTRKFGGTGLGLAISRQLVELMHGKIGLESQPGHGSRFHFRLPAGVPLAQLPTPTPADDLAVIVIGMHPLIRNAVRDTLCAESACVITVDSAISAIEALGELRPRIVRAQIIIDATAVANLDQAVSGLRAAAGGRQIDILTVMPPDGDAKPIAGVTRSLVQPLITLDLRGPSTAADTAASTRMRTLPASGSRGRALVVEDNMVNLEMARAMLDMLGFNVTTASNGQEGVHAVAAQPGFNIILMDCQMPVLDGLSASRAIRAAEKPGQRVPIVALTGNAMPGDREACFAAGMDDYLAKPFSLTALKGLIDRWTAKTCTTTPVALPRAGGS